MQTQFQKQFKPQCKTPFRTQFPRKLLQHLERRTPDRLKSMEIQILLDLAARAFRVPPKKVWQMPSAEALRAYAEFTVHCMNTRHAAPQVLYRKAYALGNRIRKLTGLTDSHDAEQLVSYLYKNIKILMYGDFPDNTHGNLPPTDGDFPAGIIVTDCYFSRYYTPEQCTIMSNVDSGIIAGICGGAESAAAICGSAEPASAGKSSAGQSRKECIYLEFTERITEGCGRCRACFRIEKGGK